MHLFTGKLSALGRREFLQLGLLAAGAAIGGAGCSSSQSTPMILSAADNQQGEHFLNGWRNGRLHFQIPVGGRGHGIALNPAKPHSVFFSRRPGTELHIVDLQSGTLLNTLTAPQHSHYFGHGDFTRDGRWLFTTENRYREQALEASHGVIGVYDAQRNYARVREIPLPVIGPHEIKVMPDNKTLVIAVGGILTHPAREREKLNLETMRPSLIYVAIESGDFLEQVFPPHFQLSLRHLDVGPDGTVLVGAQYEGDLYESRPLVFSHQPGGTLRALDHQNWLTQQQYIASVAIAADGRTALTTSPRGGVVSVWSMVEQRLIAEHPVPDVAGAGWSRQLGQFVTSNGMGQLLTVNSKGVRQLKTTEHCRWDNHMVVA